MIAVLSVLSFSQGDSQDRRILLTEDGAYACVALEGGVAVDGWYLDADSLKASAWMPTWGDDGGGASAVIIFTDEHNVAATCNAADFIDLDDVDQGGGLFDLPVLWQALGDLRKARHNCPLTCG